MKSDKLTNRLAGALECKMSLELIQQRLEEHGAKPWPLIDRAEAVLAEFGTSMRGPTKAPDESLPFAKEIDDPEPER